MLYPSPVSKFTGDTGLGAMKNHSHANRSNRTRQMAIMLRLRRMTTTSKLVLCQDNIGNESFRGMGASRVEKSSL